MSDPCESLHEFADGELPADRAEAFTDHLATCPRCQAELHTIMQLRGAASLLAPQTRDEKTSAETAPERAPAQGLGSRAEEGAGRAGGGGPLGPPAPARRIIRAAAVLLPLAAAVLIAIFVFPPRGGDLPHYTMKGPLGFVEPLRGTSTAAAAAPETPVFLPEGMVEVRLLPDVPVSTSPSAGLFVADPGGPLERVRAVVVQSTERGAFGFRAAARDVFGDRPGVKIVWAIVAESPRELDALAGKDPQALDGMPELRAASARVEYLLTPR